MFDIAGNIKIQSVSIPAATLKSIERQISTAVSAGSASKKMKVDIDAEGAIAALKRIKAEASGAAGSVKAVGNSANPIKTVAVKSEQASTSMKKLSLESKKASGALAGIMKVAQFSVITGGLMKLTETFTSAISSVISFEKEIINVTKVMSVTQAQIDGLGSSVKDMATEFGFGLNEAAQAAAVYAQQGKSMSEVIDLTRASLLLANVSVLSTVQATEALTAIINQFKFQASDAISIIDQLNEVANKFAVTEADITEAVKRAGAAAAEAGVSFELFTGVVAALQERTRLGGKVIGTTLKTLFSRLNAGNAIREMNAVGIATFNASGEFRDVEVRIKELGLVWNDLTNVQRNNLAFAVAGRRQYSSFLALMGNFGSALEAADTAMNSQGSAMTENEKIMSSMSKQIEQMGTAWDSLITSLTDTAVTNSVGALADSFGIMAKVLGSIPPELFAIMVGGFAVKGVSKAASFASAAIGGGGESGRLARERSLIEAQAKSIRAETKALQFDLKNVHRQEIALRKKNLLELDNALKENTRKLKAQAAIRTADKSVNGGITEGRIGIASGVAALATGYLETKIAAEQTVEAQKKSVVLMAAQGASAATSVVSMLAFTGVLGAVAAKLQIGLLALTGWVGLIVGLGVVAYKIYDAFIRTKSAVERTTEALDKQIIASRELKSGLDSMAKSSDKIFKTNDISARVSLVEELINKNKGLEKSRRLLIESSIKGQNEYNDSIKEAIALDRARTVFAKKIALLSKLSVTGERLKYADKDLRGFGKIDPNSARGKYLQPKIDRKQGLLDKAREQAAELSAISVQEFKLEAKFIVDGDGNLKEKYKRINDLIKQNSTSYIESMDKEKIGTEVLTAATNDHQKSMELAKNTIVETIKRQANLNAINKESRAIDFNIASISNKVKAAESEFELLTKLADSPLEVAKLMTQRTAALKELDKQNSKIDVSAIKTISLLAKAVKTEKDREGGRISNSLRGDEAAGVVQGFATSKGDTKELYRVLTSTILKEMGTTDFKGFGESEELQKKFREAIIKRFGVSFTSKEILELVKGGAEKTAIGKQISDVDKTARKSIEPVLAFRKSESDQIKDTLKRTKDLSVARQTAFDLQKKITSEATKSTNIMSDLFLMTNKEATRQILDAKRQEFLAQRNTKRSAEQLVLEARALQLKKEAAAIVTTGAKDTSGDAEKQILEKNREISAVKVALLDLEKAKTVDLFNTIKANYDAVTQDLERERSARLKLFTTTKQDTQSRVRNIDLIKSITGGGTRKEDGGLEISKESINRLLRTTTEGDRPALLKALQETAEIGGKDSREFAKAVLSAIGVDKEGSVYQEQKAAAAKLFEAAKAQEEVNKRIATERMELLTLERKNITDLAAVLSVLVPKQAKIVDQDEWGDPAGKATTPKFVQGIMDFLDKNRNPALNGGSNGTTSAVIETTIKAKTEEISKEFEKGTYEGSSKGIKRAIEDNQDALIDFNRKGWEASYIVAENKKDI